MRTHEDCLDIVHDSEPYSYTNTLLEFVDADQGNGTLKALCDAVRYNKTDRDVLVFAKSLAQAVNDALDERARKKLEQDLRNPLNSYFDESMGGFANLGIRKESL